MNEFIKLKKEINKIKNLGWLECDKNNMGEPGLKLEKLLNRNPGNFEIPDYDNIEIKTKSSAVRKNITLFNTTPDSYLFEIKRLYGLYAYPDRNNLKHKILNKTIFCNKKTYIYNNTYFHLEVFREKKIISLIVTDKNDKILDNITSWSFDLLQEKLERKLKYLCYIKIDKYYFRNKMYIKYQNDNYYILKSFDSFIKLIDSGKINITFRIGIFDNGKRKGQIHDHGTSFCINEENLELLFNKVN